MNLLVSIFDDIRPTNHEYMLSVYVSLSGTVVPNKLTRNIQYLYTHNNFIAIKLEWR